MVNLIKATNVYRVPTVDAALQLREELESMPGELTQFKYATKQIKQKGEIVEEYQLVTATIQFDSEKDPENTIREHYGDEN